MADGDNDRFPRILTPIDELHSAPTISGLLLTLATIDTDGAAEDVVKAAVEVDKVEDECAADNVEDSVGLGFNLSGVVSLHSIGISNW